MVPPHIEPADAIVVLGGGAGQDGLHLHSAARFVAGARLYQSGLAPAIAFTGGVAFSSDAASEGKAFHEAWRLFGLPDTAVIVESRATSTYENAALLTPHLANRKRILLVTSVLHMRRARDVFTRAGFTVLPAPIPQYPEVLQTPFARWQAAATLGYEWAAWLVYWVKGYL